ncbi:hypothetical protein OHS33_37610 (plasmid) [Streptomyces sp. NBC_00536]|uniref:hypothetical protein n=1 Tax=Streptomyces sp. NBC_00536 TaxID=2975769 RepID=UPI002E81BF69|nr:hypothetical protein [Streptomyces sp. NBC_00536]WUC84123.1 hypothetical protein OHS33_37610 [Streptomyces sp. NBC_00536]
MSGGRKQPVRAPAAGRVPGPRRMAVAWGVIVVVAVVSTTGLTMFDLGVGIVFGLLALWALYAWVLRKIVYGGGPVPRRTRTAYWAGGLLMVVGGVHAPDAFLAVAGAQGTATVAYSSTATGAHGMTYGQCWIDLPNGADEHLPGTGPCPAPHGAHLTVVYSPDGVVGPLLGTKRDLMWWWEAGFLLAGTALLVTTAIRTVRDPARDLPPRRRPPPRRAG